MRTDSNYYILVGDLQNWKIAIENHVWGYSEKTKGSWNKAKIGDWLAFYATSPIKKVFGFGITTDKFKDNEILWRDEKLFKRAIWNLRIRYKIVYLIDDWKEGIDLPPNTMLGTSRKRVDREFFLNLVKNADKKWKTNIIKSLEME